jgi:ABC-2 type transport system permease protein
MREIVAMMVKDITLLVRDRIGFFFTFFFPLVMAVFFGTIFSGQGRESAGLPIAVVDEDKSDGSRALAATLDSAAEFRTERMTRDEAREAVRLGRRLAYVVLPPGFGEARRRMFYGAPPEVEIGLDPSRKAEGGMIQGVLTKYLSEGMQQAFSRPDVMRQQMQDATASLDTAANMAPVRRASIRRFLGELNRFLGSREADTSAVRAAGDSVAAAWQPVTFRMAEIARVRRGPRNAYEISFPQGVMWAVNSCAFGFALSLVHERRRGTLVRLRVAPLRRSKILTGKGASCLVLILIVTTLILALGAIVFGVRPGSLPLLVLAVLSSAIGYVGMMMLIAVMGKTEAAVSGFGYATMMLTSMLGGAMVPLFVLPPWVQAVGSVSPVKWGILALEGAIWRDFTLAQMALPCGILLGVGVIGFALGTRVFRWTEA